MNDQLENPTALADSILEASLSGTMACSAIRDGNGRLQDFRIRRINSAFTRLLRIPAESAEGRVFTEIFPNAREAGILQRHMEVCTSGVPQTFEVPYKDHQLDAWYQIASAPLQDGVVITFLDITAQKEATARIHEQQELLRNILAHASSGISVTEVIRNAEGVVTDGRTLLANEAAVRYLGIPLDIYLTRTVNEIDPNIFGSPLYQAALHTLQTGTPLQMQYYFQPANCWLELSVNRMDSERLINIFTDISAERQSTLVQASLVDELKRSNESLEEFAYAASHDLQEPLRKIHYFSDRLKTELDETLTDAQRNMFGRMEAASARMRRLIDDLLAYSRLSRMTPEDTTEKVDLNEILLLALQDLEAAVQQTGAQVGIDELPSVEGNGRQLRQLFLNLLSNALKYRKAGQKPRVSIRYTLQPDAHLIEVQDNGIGFEPEHAERIFQVFQRLHGRNEYEGTGVGLAIAQKVAQRHGGTLTADSVPGEGSVFRLRLPVSGPPAANFAP